MSGGARAGLLAVLLATGACGGGTEDPQQIATVDSTALGLPAFEAYLAINLPDDPEAAADDPAVLSRLLDNFILEAALLERAVADGFGVDDREVEMYLRMGKDEVPEPPALDPARFEAVRRAMIVQKYREAYLSDSVRITPEMVETYVAEQRERLEPRPMVVLRALMLASAEQAAEVHGEIRRRRMTFDEAVIAYASMPGQGLPVEMARGGLPPELEAALRGLRAGRVSRPVELHGTHYLFQLVDRRTGTGVDEQELRVRARDELLERLRGQALERLESEVLQQARVRIEPENLPFRYVGEDGNNGGPSGVGA